MATKAAPREPFEEQLLTVTAMDVRQDVDRQAPVTRKKKQKVKFKKAPQAPRRFKSAYMFFSTAKHPEIRARLTAEGKTGLKVSAMRAMRAMRAMGNG